MLEARMRLAVAVVLFCGWIGWLAYLAATTTNPIVLSRPQFLVADAHVIAQLDGDADGPSRTIKVEKVLHAVGEHPQLKARAEVLILLLASCGPEQGWSGPGEYILPLSKSGDKGYLLTKIPRSSGFRPLDDVARLRIYPVTPESLRRYEQLPSLADRKENSE